METLFSRLLEILNLQREIVEVLSDITMQQHEALRANDLPALIALSPGQSRAAAELAEYDRKREALEHELARALNLPDGTKLGRLINYAPGGMKDKLVFLREDLKEKAELMLDTVRVNRYIMTHSLSIVNQLLKLYAAPSVARYAPSGRIMEGKTITVLDKQI